MGGVRWDELSVLPGSAPPTDILLASGWTGSQTLTRALAPPRYEHDELDACAGQAFFPELLTGEAGRQLCSPSERGFECEIETWLDDWAALKLGDIESRNDEAAPFPGFCERRYADRGPGAA